MVSRCSCNERQNTNTHTHANKGDSLSLFIQNNVLHVPITRNRSNRCSVCTITLTQRRMRTQFYFPIGSILEKNIVYSFLFGRTHLRLLSVNRDRLHFEVFTSWQRKYRQKKSYIRSKDLINSKIKHPVWLCMFVFVQSFTK